jgi:NitT/TauT family transport system permease protein
MRGKSASVRESGRAATKSRGNRIESFLNRYPLAFHVAMLAVLAVLWESAVNRGLLAEYVLGRPQPVFARFFSFVTATSTLRHVGITTASLAIGLGLGGMAGIIVAVLLARQDFQRSAFEPVIITLYTIPRLALVPLFLIWFGFGMTPQVLVAAIHAFVIFYLAMVAAIDSLPRELVLNVRGMGGSSFHVARYVSVPYALPYVASAFRQATALGLGSVILAEMLGPRGGIGFLLRDRLGLFDTTGVVALVLVGASLGVVLDRVGALIEARAKGWG